MRRREWDVNPRELSPCATKNTRDEISKLNAEIMGVNSDPYYGAPVIVLVLGDSSVGTYVEDCSCVLENIMLAARKGLSHRLGTQRTRNLRLS